MTKIFDRSETLPEILSRFDLPNPTVKELDSSELWAGQVSTENGRFFLKLSAGEQTRSRLLSRLHFLDFLREGGIAIPETVLTATGEPFVPFEVDGEPGVAVLSNWVDGWSPGYNPDMSCLERCGEVLARLHLRSRSYSEAESVLVPDWEGVYLVDSEDWISDYLSSISLEKKSFQCIQDSIDRIRLIDESLSRESACFGLIHADFHGENLIVDGQQIWVLDFDDLGFGHFLFDVTWPALLAARDGHDASRYVTGFLRGYKRHRPLSVSERERLPEFYLAAGIAALEMIHTSHLDNRSPQAQEWLQFVLHWLKSH